MDDPDPEAAFGEAEAVHHLERVVVAVPDGEAALRQALRGHGRSEPADVEAEGRDPAVHRRQAVEGACLGEAGQKALAELPLVRDDRVEADRAQVPDGGDEAGKELVRQGAALEAGSERALRRRPDLVGAPALEQLRPREREPEVRPVKLVRRAEQHVCAHGADVDRPVGRIVHRVDPGQRPGRMRELADARDVDERPDRVRGPRKRDDARPLAELRGQGVQVERRVVEDLREPHPQPEVVGELEPRRDVAVVVELRDNDLVSGRELAADRPGEREVERRHVGAEHDFLGAAP